MLVSPPRPRHTHHRLATQVSIETKGQKAAAAAWLLLLVTLYCPGRGARKPFPVQCPQLGKVHGDQQYQASPCHLAAGASNINHDHDPKNILQYNYKIIFMFSSVIMCTVKVCGRNDGIFVRPRQCVAQFPNFQFVLICHQICK